MSKFFYHFGKNSGNGGLKNCTVSYRASIYDTHMLLLVFCIVHWSDNTKKCQHVEDKEEKE